MMMTPIGDDENNVNNNKRANNTVINHNAPALDLDDSVAGASVSSIETMMKQALAALQWKREHPDEEPPHALLVAETNCEDHVMDLDDTTSESNDETETNLNSSPSFPRGARWYTICGTSTVFSVSSVVMAIICILIIAIFVSQKGNGGSSNSNAPSHGLDTVDRPRPPNELSPGDESTTFPPQFEPQSTTTTTMTSSPSWSPTMPPLTETTMAQPPWDQPVQQCSNLCTVASDCHDASNLQGLHQECGELSCVAGVCQFEAWVEDESCIDTNFVRCHGDDTKCTKGPSGLSYHGACTGFNNTECVYRWCRGGTDNEAEVSSSSSVALPSQCSTPCLQPRDCEDVNNLHGLDPACGEVFCDELSGFCRFNAWNVAGACGDTNYLYCSGDDTRCIKGPSELSFEGTCTGFENSECVYRWCP